jgi:hypothetical protein
VRFHTLLAHCGEDTSSLLPPTTAVVGFEKRRDNGRIVGIFPRFPPSEPSGEYQRTVATANMARLKPSYGRATAPLPALPRSKISGPE